MPLAVQPANAYPSPMTDNNKNQQQVEAETSTSKIYNNRKNNKKNNNHIYYNSHLNIGTYNVMGFNLETKQRKMFDEYKYLDLDIIGLTETKLNENNSKITSLKYLKGYKTWWTGLQDTNYTGGVGIAIKQELEMYVTTVIKKLGRIISIDLNFKGTNKTRIINTYINSNGKEKTERENVIKELNFLIKETFTKKIQINSIR